MKDQGECYYFPSMAEKQLKNPEEGKKDSRPENCAQTHPVLTKSVRLQVQGPIITYQICIYLPPHLHYYSLGYGKEVVFA